MSLCDLVLNFAVVIQKCIIDLKFVVIGGQCHGVTFVFCFDPTVVTLNFKSLSWLYLRNFKV